MEFLLALVIVALVAAFVSVPLRRAAGEEVADSDEAELADLETRKEVLYREIRDIEADHAAGKMNDEDFRPRDRELRAEAIDLLKRIDRLRERSGRPAAG